MRIAFGFAERERLEVEVRGFERAPTGEFWDDNWLKVDVRVWAGAFQGTTSASILTIELAKFLAGLRQLLDLLSGSAAFSTVEQQLKLRLDGDGRGHFVLCGEVSDQPGGGNRLHFTLGLDPSQLISAIRELEAITSKYPVRKG